MKIKFRSYLALVLLTFTLFYVYSLESTAKQSDPKVTSIQESFNVGGTNWTVGCFSCHNQSLHYIGMDGFGFSLTNDSLYFVEDGGKWPNPYGTTSYTSIGAYTTFPTDDGSLVIVYDGRARAKHPDAALLGIRIYDPSNMTWLMSSASHPENISSIKGTGIDSGWQQMIINITIPGYDELAVFWSFNDFFNTDWQQEFWVDNIQVNPEIIEDTEPNFIPLAEGSEDISYCMNCFPSAPRIYPKWTIYDDNPANYTIYVNSTIVENGSYSSGDTILYNIYNEIELVVGEYNLTILATDLQNNSVVDTIMLFTYELTYEINPPDIIGLQFTLIEENYSAYLYWWATDENPSYYEIFVNNESTQTGTWTNDTLIPFKVENISGEYNVTIVVYDMFGSYDVDTFIFSFEFVPKFTDFPLPILALPLICLIFVSIRRKKKKQ